MLKYLILFKSMSKPPDRPYVMCPGSSGSDWFGTHGQGIMALKDVQISVAVQIKSNP